jgi:hypothetical protein
MSEKLRYRVSGDIVVRLPFLLTVEVEDAGSDAIQANNAEAAARAELAAHAIFHDPDGNRVEGGFEFDYVAEEGEDEA